MITERVTCWAVTCDAPDCHAELLAPSEEEAGGDASLAGWKTLPGDKHVCRDCQVGKSTASARAKHAYGASEVTVPMAPRDFDVGEEVHAEDGTLVGTTMAPARAGEPLQIKLRPPTVQHPPGATRADAKREGGFTIEDAPEPEAAPRTRWRD